MARRWLRRCASWAMSQWTRLRPSRLLVSLSYTWTRPRTVPYWADSLLVGDLPDAAIDSVLEAVGPNSGSQLLVAELRHCGGALSRPARDAGALSSLPGAFLAFGVGVVPMPEAMAPTRALARRVQVFPSAVRRRSIPQLLRGALRVDPGVPARHGRPPPPRQGALRPRRPFPRKPPGYRLEVTASGI